MGRNEKPRHVGKHGQGISNTSTTTSYHTLKRAATTARRLSRQGSSLRAVHPDGLTAAARPMCKYRVRHVFATVRVLGAWLGGA